MLEIRRATSVERVSVQGEVSVGQESAALRGFCVQINREGVRAQSSAADAQNAFFCPRASRSFPLFSAVRGSLGFLRRGSGRSLGSAPSGTSFGDGTRVRGHCPLRGALRGGVGALRVCLKGADRGKAALVRGERRGQR